MGDLFNTLNKSLPGDRRYHWKDNSCVVHCLYSQLHCIRTFRKMFVCLRRSDRCESDGMGHVCMYVCTNEVWPPLQPVSVAQNKPSTMSSSTVQSTNPPNGLHGLTVLDGETTEWLLNTCPDI